MKVLAPRYTSTSKNVQYQSKNIIAQNGPYQVHPQ
jgi:hypothetical protein